MVLRLQYDYSSLKLLKIRINSSKIGIWDTSCLDVFGQGGNSNLESQRRPKELWFPFPTPQALASSAYTTHPPEIATKYFFSFGPFRHNFDFRSLHITQVVLTAIFFFRQDKTVCKSPGKLKPIHRRELILSCVEKDSRRANGMVTLVTKVYHQLPRSCNLYSFKVRPYFSFMPHSLP